MKQRGFTLIEIIIATSLFSLLMASYYTVVMNVMILEEHARDQRAFASVGPAILDLVEDDLLSVYTHPRALNAYPYRGDDDSLGRQPADEMNFVVTRAIHFAERALSPQLYKDRDTRRGGRVEVAAR